MKKTLFTILIFLLLMLLLLGVSTVYNRLRPAQSQTLTVEKADTESVIPEDEMSLEAATSIQFSTDTVHIRGDGAAVSGDTLTVAYPGTYILSGVWNDGCVVVDCEADSGIYLVLNGVSVNNDDGPAIYIKDADFTSLYLMENTENSLSDGAVYQIFMASDGQAEQKQPDAVLYSADSLSVSGGGKLQITANCGNAIHSRDTVELQDGTIAASCMADGIKAADGITISGGALTLICADDGLVSSNADISVAGGTIRLTCGDNAASASEKIEISGGEVTVTACCDGLKAPQTDLSGGAVTINASQNAVSALMGDVDSGLKASDCEVRISGASLYALAPCCVQSDGGFIMSDGAAFLRSSSLASPLDCATAAVSGGALFMAGSFEQNAVTADGVNAVYYRSETEIDGTTALKLFDSEGTAIFALTPNINYYSLMIAYGGITEAQSYTLSCGGQDAEFTAVAGVSTAMVPSRFAGFGGFFGGRP